MGSWTCRCREAIKSFCGGLCLLVLMKYEIELEDVGFVGGGGGMCVCVCVWGMKYSKI